MENVMYEALDIGNVPCAFVALAIELESAELRGFMTRGFSIKQSLFQALDPW